LEGKDVLSDMLWMHSENGRPLSITLGRDGEMAGFFTSSRFLEEVTLSCTLFLLVSFACLSFGSSRVLWTIRFRISVLLGLENLISLS